MFTQSVVSQGTLLYSEITILSSIVMVIIALSAMNMSQSVTDRNRLFILSVLCAAVANLCDFVWNMALTQTWECGVPVRYLMNCGYFLSLGTSMYCWFLYTLVVVNRKMPSKRLRTLAFIPIAILAAVLLTSCFNGCAFHIDENGEYHRGKLFYLQHALSYGYVLAASLVCLRRAMISDYYDNRDELLTMAAFILPPLICIGVQSLLQNIPILAVGIVISYILVYINILESMISNDELTGISNRRELLRHLTEQIRRDEEEQLCFMFMDLDGFKNINDRFGHEEGDRALRAFATALKQVASECEGVCARYGGDEFALTARLSDDDIIRVKKRIYDQVKRKCAEHNLKCDIDVSIGSATYSAEMNGIQELISKADVAMYEVKAAKKKARA